MDKNYNKFQRAYEVMTELTKEPILFEPAELSNINSKELNYLKETLELMANYMDILGFELKGIKKEILMPIYDELEKRSYK
ncbi:TPA: hypothetical protein RQJ16_001779 [Campylobacter fetus subsp. venerealis]|nr:hypothetical protein [Campylobacter fetus subsp. venerealis]HDX6296102.1 hypothetical protein [Campylobacter fetus subsp. venerealis]HDX6309286.1 hypothetical protein [Campylobacter fetus subsp. venerealis]HDX8135932.1 hypothetical protein [Campylobacter fetus subsp. venerealis]